MEAVLDDASAEAWTFMGRCLSAAHFGTGRPGAVPGLSRSVSEASVGLPFIHLAVGGRPRRGARRSSAPPPARRWSARRWTKASGSAGRTARPAGDLWPSAGWTGTPSRSTALLAAYCVWNKSRSPPPAMPAAVDVEEMAAILEDAVIDTTATYGLTDPRVAAALVADAWADILREEGRSPRFVELATTAVQEVGDRLHRRQISVGPQDVRDPADGHPRSCRR